MSAGIEIYGQGDDGLKRTQRIAGELAELLDLPGEALGEMKLSAVGGRRTLIENHGGLLACTGERISVRNGRGILSLVGTELCIEAMTEKEVLVSGRLDRIEWDG